MVARDSRLQKITMSFHGRKMLGFENGRFIENLREIKADEVVLAPGPRHRWRYRHKDASNIDYGVETYLVTKMQRKKKLYKTS